jgi:hypothetical protein
MGPARRERLEEVRGHVCHRSSLLPPEASGKQQSGAETDEADYSEEARCSMMRGEVVEFVRPACEQPFRPDLVVHGLDRQRHGDALGVWP